jgi:hypothetical protein
MKLISEVTSMTMTLIVHLIFIAVMMGLLLLLLMAAEANNRTMTQVRGSAIGMVILIQLTL